jgi:hypothetical protein
MRKAHPIPKTELKESRQKAKMKRKRGLDYLKNKGIDPVKHSQTNDPLFKIKGIERHLALHKKTL